MCGIFGIVSNGKETLTNHKILRCIKRLFILSESRGKEAAGVALCMDENIYVAKAGTSASSFIRSKDYKDIIGSIQPKHPFMAMGHARMVTNGDASNQRNNQPVLKEDFVCIHNGIIVNDGELWKNNPDINREMDVDTEVFLSLLGKNGYDDNPLKALAETRKNIKGSLSVAVLHKKLDHLLLFTNVGSLYFVKSDDVLLFASERYILEALIEKENLNDFFEKKSVTQIQPENGILVDLSSLKKHEFSVEDVNEDIVYEKKNREVNIERTTSVVSKAFEVNKCNFAEVSKLIDVDIDKIHKLRRCTKCLLPETFPGIEFDDSGECSICKSYKKIQLKGRASLEKIFENSAKKNQKYDCIVPLSGGRDSCYMIHYLVKEMGLHPVAYTYDWGMVTDLARRNIQRMCADLHVEHVLISADISKKRENVRKNVEAWLHHPTLATVPLFMAGDKQFFYYAQLLKKQMNIGQIVFGQNALEETGFKSRFAGAMSSGKNGVYYDLSAFGKARMMLTYGKEFIINPKYINSSLLDSFGGFASYYLLPKDYIHFFDYIPWKQETVVNTIREKYDWELAEGSDETWRIGDGTAPFYNYIYYKLAGFTEFDTFKSNQIREGIISREEALDGLEKSNTIMVDQFIWYCNTIGIDPIKSLNIINSQKTLYDHIV